MKQLILALSLLTLFSCNGSSNGGSGKKSPGDLVAACEAATVDDFFAAMAGGYELTAIDTFTEREPAETTEDDSFVHEQNYSVTFGDDKTLSIPTEKGELNLTFGDEVDDLFEPYPTVIYVQFRPADLDVTVRLSCEEDEEPSFFIAFASPDGGTDFFWRLREATEE